MTYNQDIFNKLKLSLIPGINHKIAKEILLYCNSPDKIFKIPDYDLKNIAGMTIQRQKSLKNHKIFDNTVNQLLKNNEKHNINFCFFDDNDYPKLLKETVDCPYILFYKGNFKFTKKIYISIVGTRKATNYGRNNVKNLIEGVIELGYRPVIISGLAYGIDIEAHKIALENNLTTLSVLAHGLDMIYPAEHSKIAENICDNGLLISEFPIGATIHRANFLSRNRIIAGLSEASIIIESAQKGGALVTADIASSYSREVFAFPGKNTDKYSLGCNHLIKMSKAAMIETAKDLEYFMQWDVNQKLKAPRQQELPFFELNELEQKIFNIINKEISISFDNLLRLLGINHNNLSATLLEMEFKNIICTLPGKMYRLN